MKVLILGLNYAPEPVGIAVYTTGMAEALAARGHDVQVIAGQPYYPVWKVFEGHSRFWYGRASVNGVDLCRVPHYVPKKPTGRRRLLHHLSFAVSALLPTLFSAISQRPDVVLTIAPSLAAAPLASLAARLAGAKSWLHVQDFELDAAMATGLLGKFAGLGRIERGILGGFDQVSTISAAMGIRLAQKGVDRHRIVQFPNSADLSAIQPMRGPSPFRQEWGITTPHVALYSGAIANKQGIDIIVRAARQLRSRDDLTFVICGEGPNLDGLKAQAADLANLQFRALQPATRLNALLGLASVHLLPQRASAADLVLPSKLANMLASGRPIIATAAPGTGLADAVSGCGLITPPDDGAAFATAITTLLDDPVLHANLANAARHRAEERWNSQSILNGFIGQIEDLATATPLREQGRALKGAP